MLFDAPEDNLVKTFVGRESVTTEILRQVEGRESAIVLKGPSGSGKTALLAHLLIQLAKKHYSFIIMEGETWPEILLKRIFQKAQKKGNKKAADVYSSGSGQDLRQKILWFTEHFLQEERLALVWDDFSVNLNTEGKFRNDRLREFLFYLRDALKDKEAFLLFTAETDIPGFTAIPIGDFSPEEIKKLFSHFRALSRLGEKSREKLLFDMGGNPRSLELLDHIAEQEFGVKKFDWETLKSKIPGLSARVLYKNSLQTDFSALLLEKIFSTLNQAQVEFLEALASGSGPVDRDLLTALGKKLSPRQRAQLENLSLLQYSDKRGVYQVHPLTARFIQGQMTEAKKRTLHLLSAQYFETIIKGEGDDDIDIEKAILARRLYLEAGEWDTAARLTFDLDRYLSQRGYMQLAFDLLMEFDKPDYSQPDQVYLWQRLAFFSGLFGRFDSVVAYQQKLLKIYEQMNDLKAMALGHLQIGAAFEARRKIKEGVENYEKAESISRDLGDNLLRAQSLIHLGRVAQKRGQSEPAEKHFRAALDLYENRGEPRGVAETLHLLGRLKEESGELDPALDYHQRAYQVREKLADDRGLAESRQQLGNIHYLKGDLDSALAHYQCARELNKKAGEKRGHGNTLGQIGMIYQRRGENDTALAYYRESLAIFEGLDDPQGISSSLHQIGRVFQDQGKLDQALDYFKQALEIREKNGDMPGMGIGHGQLGLLYLERGEYEESLRSSIKAFMIFDRLAAPQVQLAQKNIQKVREKLLEERFFEILKEFDITPATAETTGDISENADQTDKIEEHKIKN